MVILVDMDDTIENLMPAWVDWLNEKHGTSVSVEDVTEWNVSKFFPTLTRSDVYAPLSDDEFWKTVTPKDGAVEALRQFIADGNEVYVVTTSSYKALHSKMENVLFKYFPFITWDNVIVTTHKQMVHGDVLIDDGIHNLDGGDYLKILMDAPHNRKLTGAQKAQVKRAYNWDDVRKIIHEAGAKAAKAACSIYDVLPGQIALEF